jgi:peptidoglycan/LPS O-acetylase OafA/YrhL
LVDPGLTPVSVEAVADPAAVSVPVARPRLDHVDAIRPVKQLGVVSTHTILFFAPGASILAGASVMLLHVSREAFLFVSACMLTYSNGDLAKLKFRRFYSRRAISVALPYACWTTIYWISEARTSAPAPSLHHLGFLFATGYYQLYYLLVIAQFYLLFPLVLVLLRATRRHPLRLLAASAVVQLTLTSLIHWQVVPSFMAGQWATREITSYQFYLLGGCLAAVHMTEFNHWLVDHARLVVVSTFAAAAVTEIWFTLAWYHAFGWMGAATDPFQPIVLPFNVGAICTLYLFGRVLADSRRSERFRLWVRRGSDSAYGVFLGQMLIITVLVQVHWRDLDNILPWPVVVTATTLGVFVTCALISLALNRTAFSRPLTGQPRLRRARRPVPGVVTV